ncbi:antirestriction protein [Photorhabdus heterorhabditis]|uniref:Antirestriction protein n=1 Tax=Photorhabdus heterorhabditis TaxID=880156 RepID=A0A5B0X842_9GAMM|nr:antirestriction protein [Photorhabdus heterorhabditis]KAA1195463.1 antirestriction protein [Photorhabdus heterorhabditis]
MYQNFVKINPCVVGKKNATENIPLVTKKKITWHFDRRKFLSEHLKELFVVGNTYIYSWMDENAEGYLGGFWEIFELSNGGFFIAPPDGYVVSLKNKFKGYLNSEQCGIAVTFYTLKYFQNLAKWKNDELLYEHYSMMKNCLFEYIATFNTRTQKLLISVIS